MSRSLPTGRFRWVGEAELDDLAERLPGIPESADVGYILEVDLDYPECLHEAHADYPLAPERVKVTQDMLSPYQIELATSFSRPSGDEGAPRVPESLPKLIPTVTHKKNYVVHYHLLNLYLQQGLVLKRVHRALEFHQSPWLKPFIDFNSAKRAAAPNKFEGDILKLASNCIYGKSLESQRKHRNILLSTSMRQLKKMVAKPTFKGHKIFHENLCAIERVKPHLLLNRPIYLGFTILDLSKYLMYNFHYNYVKRRYPGNRSKLLFTDTDSLTYSIATDDLYGDIRSDTDWFDFSNYPEDHPNFYRHNARVAGYFKDELEIRLMTTFVGLRPKMYSLKFDDKEIKRAKGITKSVVSTALSFEDYVHCLIEDEAVYRDVTNIRSEFHRLLTTRTHKKALCSYDDKRYILADKISTLPFGHKDIDRL